jgi:hypothetical protein
VGLGTPQAGDFAPRQELSWEDSTQELPLHSFAVEGDTTVIPKAPQESVLTAVGSVVGGALKQAVVQLRPQLPPADFFRPRKPRPTIPFKEAGPVPGGWEDIVIYQEKQRQKKPLERRRTEMEQPTRHRQQPSEANVQRYPAPTARAAAPTAAATTNAPPATKTAMEEDRDEFLTALCQRLALTVEERLLPRIQSLEDKMAGPRDPELQYRGELGPECRDQA